MTKKMMPIQRTKTESLEKEKDLPLDPKAAIILIVVQEAEKGEREASQVQDLAVLHQSKTRSSFHSGHYLVQALSFVVSQ